MSTKRKMACMIGVAVMVSVACLSTLWAQDTLFGWKSEGRGTHAMLLYSMKESGIMTTLSFKNVSEKSITAFVLSFANDQEGSFQDHGCFGAETNCFAPGSVFPVTFMTNDLSAVTDRTILITAILFEDGTSEGSDREVEHINSLYLGMMFETERIKNILISPIGSKVNKKQPPASAEEWDINDEDLKALVAAIGKPPQSPQAAMDSLEHVRLPGVSVDNIRTASSVTRHAFFTGVSSIRQRALRELAHLHDRPIAPENSKVPMRPPGFAQLRRKYEAMSLKHHAFCEGLQGGIHQ